MWFLAGDAEVRVSGLRWTWVVILGVLAGVALTAALRSHAIPGGVTSLAQVSAWLAFAVLVLLIVLVLLGGPDNKP